ncbi:MULTISPECIES: UDP-glucose 4-epimerase GalE [unclassified Mesorhizobium]|jgi:UDP-glucose 4-epimerase|uniref:UDP-glucose 4-epimerase GalE n=1 Tax=unclassified Mesorhizobium TaxID=325217 RepID=UPI0008E53565|nr:MULTISPECIES: UDP-glucose 4-epimerase GalE [unclassified Mesorhizobium]RJG46606.1 UDP-glucose 4-epimerase GalE [Mesorhizobium sp. DCY119]SFT98925.1 UDP-galactose 4-epimerase [Mesorhizobium sp. YR577]
MAVMVTGGAGYIGSHMVWKLLDQGEEVVVVDRLSTGFDWAVPAEAELVVGDIADQALIEATMKRKKVDAVIHFAGSIIVPESVSDPLGYYLNNTAKSRDLIESAVRSGVKNFIFSSTAAVYGSPERIPVAENEAAAPESPYGTSKLMTELMLRDAAAAHDLDYTILRYFNVSGADPKMRTGQSTKGATHLIKVASEAATGKRDYMEVYGTDYPTPDGTCVRDYIHVSDLANAHYLALKRLRDGGKSIIANCGYGQGYSVHEVIDAVKRVVGHDFEVRTRERRPGDAVAIVANADLAKSEFQWKPEYDNLETIVSHAIQWEEMLKKRNT